MSVLDKYFELQNIMSSISKTKCSEEEIEQYFQAGEEILSILDKVVAQFKSEWGETPPVIYCRDELPDMYMRYGKWANARKAIDRCYEVGILNESELNNYQNWINACENATKELVNHLNSYPGALQKDIYSRLHYVDKESLKWVLRFYKKIEKLKFKNTNKLFLPEQNYLISKEKVKKDASHQNSQNNSFLPNKLTNINFPDWYVSISFGKSSSKNYDTAVYLAKLAPKYIYSENNSIPIHQAIYSQDPTEYLQFIKLYELVSNWKSTTVVINGQLVDRKIIGNINYCYGDKCRSGKSDFCFGASQFTSNPIGCHRAQMHDYKDPWYTFGIMDTKGIFHIDKNAIKEELRTRLKPYQLCPALNMDEIMINVDKLPNTINPKKDTNWEYTTIMKNGIPIDGIQPTLEAKGLIHTIKLNIDLSSNINDSTENNIENKQYIINDKLHKNKKQEKPIVKLIRRFLHVIIFIFTYTVLMLIPTTIIENPFLGILTTIFMLYPAIKITSKVGNKVFKK